MEGLFLKIYSSFCCHLRSRLIWECPWNVPGGKGRCLQFLPDKCVRGLRAGKEIPKNACVQFGVEEVHDDVGS